MAYLLVDRIAEVQPGAVGSGRIASARGLKAVSRCDPFVRPVPGGGLELPACLVGEAIGQLAAWAAMSLCGFARRPVAGLTAEAVVGVPARPGDLLLLEAEIESLEDDAVHYHGRASVGGRPALALRDVVGPMLPMEDFDDPREVEREFGRLGGRGGREGEPPASPPESEGQPLFLDGKQDPPAGHPAIDAVLQRTPERVVGVTCVSRAAPYLVGHFPRSPVLPATLLLDAQVWLATLIEGEAGAARDDRPRPRAARLADLKMRDFIRPGARVVSEVKVRSRGDGRTVVDLRGRVGQRTVSSGVLELVRGPEAGR